MEPTATILVSVADWTPQLLAEHQRLLAARNGWPLTADELADWLRAVENRQRALEGRTAGTTGGNEAAAGRAVPVPGTDVVLHLPTIRARIRLDQVREWEQTGHLPAAAGHRIMAYILAHSGDATALARLTSPEAARRTADDWALAHLGCRQDDVDRAVQELIPQDLYPPAEDTPPGGEAHPPTGPLWSGSSAGKSGATRSTG